MNSRDLAFLRERVSLLSAFSAEVVEQIASTSEVVAFQQGELVVLAGEKVHALGIVLEGDIIATAPDGQLLGNLGVGDTFGEMALMSGDPAIADLKAGSFTRAVLVPITTFRSLIMAHPPALQQIAKTVGERFQRVMSDPLKAAALAQKRSVADLLDLKAERHEIILVVNCGSSSLKYSVFNTRFPDRNVSGCIESIGRAGMSLRQKGPRGQIEDSLQGDHAAAFNGMLRALLDRDVGAIEEVAQISAVGHRVVHGGEAFTSATLLDDAVLERIEKLAALAPLHNPINVLGIREGMRVFPSVPHVAVFDTAFHATMPSHAYLYGLPTEIYRNQNVRRYGFHGSSHSYVSLAAAQFLSRDPRELKIVSCHLGNGASVCAIDHGRSVDTSMGFTPGEGLIMGTRCGDLDSGVVTYLERTLGKSPAEIDDLLNRHSGLLGMSGISADMRDIEREADAGKPGALVAYKAFGYRLRKYIGAYIAAMGGLDVLIFTAGIGQGSAGVRAAALQGLRCMGIRLDEDRNRNACSPPQVTQVSADDSPVTVLVIPTDEERMIARETLRTLEHDFLIRASDACRKEPIPLEVSAHHIHLAQEHVEALFGPGHQLTHHADLSQPGQYACKEQLTIIGPKGKIERVRVLGPTRKATQVEIAMTEQFKLGIQPPIRESGDIQGSPGCILEGPAGRVQIEQGVICALRHIHMTPGDALRYGVRDKATVRVRVRGDRELLFGDVRIRVDPNFALAMHIDTDEANAANVRNGEAGFIDGIQQDE